jgi:hypothetical protein
MLAGIVGLSVVVACSSSSTSTATTPDAGGVDAGGEGNDSGSTTDSGGTTDSGSTGDGGEQQISGSTSNPKSCSDVCSAAGLTCDPHYQWGMDLNGSLDGTAGGYAEYQSSDGTYAFYALDCATPPNATKDLGGNRTGNLKDFSCACK